MACTRSTPWPPLFRPSPMFRAESRGRTRSRRLRLRRLQCVLDALERSEPGGQGRRIVGYDVQIAAQLPKRILRGRQELRGVIAPRGHGAHVEDAVLIALVEGAFGAKRGGHQ